MLLVDPDASCGVNGNNVCVPKSFCTVNVIGIDNHQLTNLPIGTIGGVVSTQKDPGFTNIHRYA